MPERRRALLTILALAVMVVSACGDGAPDGWEAVRDDSRQMYLEIPSDWSVVPEETLQDLGRTPFVAQTTLEIPVVSRVVFHAPGFDVATAATDPWAAYPTPLGSAVVRRIPADARDSISRALIAELVVPYHSRPIATEHLKQDVEVADGWDGVELLVTYADDEEQLPAAVLFIAVTDPEDTLMYSIAVGCSTECYTAYGDAIVDIVDSWLVNTR